MRGTILSGIAFVWLALMAQPLAAPGDIEVTLMASTPSWADSEFVGHAFMCVAYHLNSGIKEDCYGFYPRGSTTRAVVGGPGIAASEFARNPSRFSRVTVSVTKKVSDAQRRAVLANINQWNGQDYALITANCINLVDSVATAAGFASPGTKAGELPESYLRRLKAANP